MHREFDVKSIGNIFNNVAIICKILPSNNHFHTDLSHKTHNTLLISAGNRLQFSLSIIRPFFRAMIDP